MSIYDLSFNDSRGYKVEMSQYKGKVLLLVNTATKCGLSFQFKTLEDIYQKYKDRNFTIIGFPCNQFANQEPESNQTMTETCRINFGVTFLLSEKILVNGENTHPIFLYLKENSKSGLFGKIIKWNFTKFLVSSDGGKIIRYSPTTSPKRIEKDLIDFLK
ncbi:MAG: glutathione peroxidase [Candidatus Delongbacteria bacterium]|nr:glutathione peroxidase [Candidatus Delongbacteria bacterium]MBN2836980.1 glutathione peroxidase [Candidatus Delongbacteria bacterium]